MGYSDGAVWWNILVGSLVELCGMVIKFSAVNLCGGVVRWTCIVKSVAEYCGGAVWYSIVLGYCGGAVWWSSAVRCTFLGFCTCLEH